MNISRIETWQQVGKEFVLKEQTTKPFERFKADASRGLMRGLSGLVTTHHWKGSIVEVRSPGVVANVAYDHGSVTCRVEFQSLYATPLWPVYTVPIVGEWGRKKVLSDIEATTREVCESFDTGNRDVFIVHGHDAQAVVEIKALLGEFGLRPIVLNEQDARGLTIIENFEHYASSCAFAIILMTPDDSSGGETEKEKKKKMRARQNVILELGWFIAKLGRNRVVILYKDKLEIPSDIHGVIYLKFNNAVTEVRDKIRQRLKGVRMVE